MKDGYGNLAEGLRDVGASLSDVGCELVVIENAELREALHAMKIISRAEKERIVKLDWMLHDVIRTYGHHKPGEWKVCCQGTYDDAARRYERWGVKSNV
jgi:hypothetical protein